MTSTTNTKQDIKWTRINPRHYLGRYNGPEGEFKFNLTRVEQLGNQWAVTGTGPDGESYGGQWFPTLSAACGACVDIVRMAGKPAAPFVYEGYEPNRDNEARTPNGDLSFDATDDAVVRARNNLRYWIDRAEHGTGGIDQLREAGRWMVATVDRDYTPPAPPAGNTTTFAQHWMEANNWLLAAVANPSQNTFDLAHSWAIRAVGSAFDGGAGIEWDMAQSLARMVRDVAAENGFKV